MAFARSFSFTLTFCCAVLFLNSWVCLSAYVPGFLSGKYHSVYIGQWGFNNWFCALQSKYSDDANVGYRGVRDVMAPHAMVDNNGTLHVICLSDFDDYGPKFRVCQYSYSGGSLTSRANVYRPWNYGYSSSSISTGFNPNFGYEADEMWFKYGFHNAFHPCIAQELEGVSSDYIYVFNLIPSNRMVWSGVQSGYEGGLWARFKKSTLEFPVSNATGRNFDWGGNGLAWCSVLRLWPSDNRPASFPYYRGNFQAFVYGSYYWLFNLWQVNDNDGQNSGVNCSRYSRDTLARSGYNGVASQGSVGLNTALQVSSRFFRVGSYVYFLIMDNGYWFKLYRITPNLTSSDSPGTTECVVANGTMECYIETTQYGHSWAPYSYDYCLMDEDGTPCSSSSSDGTRKILCIFGLAGGGPYSVCGGDSYNWKSPNINWTYNYAAAAIGSVYLTTELDQGLRPHAYAQNRIYVTEHSRASKTYVDQYNSTKTDEYRLYLNSHKMVLYTSPSGKHYIIYAYCYPGKKKHLYLGYAPYFVDSNHEVRLATKFEFKQAGNSGWGDSFIPNCTRIISMDLKNGHLWITYVNDIHAEFIYSDFYYFHIPVADLIRE